MNIPAFTDPDWLQLLNESSNNPSKFPKPAQSVEPMYQASGCNVAAMGVQQQLQQQQSFAMPLKVQGFPNYFTSGAQSGLPTQLHSALMKMPPQDHCGQNTQADMSEQALHMEALLEIHSRPKRPRTQSEMDDAVERIKQKRRESAQRSRQRKGVYVKALENENSNLKEEMMKLRSALAGLLGQPGVQFLHQLPTVCATSTSLTNGASSDMSRGDSASGSRRESCGWDY
jgi:hypothetical protein